MFQMRMTFNGRQPQILKVIYLSNHWSDLKLILPNQTLLKLYSNSNGKQLQFFLKWKTTSIRKRLRGKLEFGSVEMKTLKFKFSFLKFKAHVFKR
jgi:hypothetical protein